MDVLAIDSTGNHTSVASKIGDDLLSISVDHKRKRSKLDKSLESMLIFCRRDCQSGRLFLL